MQGKWSAWLAALALSAGFASGGAAGELDRVKQLFVDPIEGTPEVGQLTVRFMGNTNLLFSDGITSILIDGWFTRPGFMRTGFGRIKPDLEHIAQAKKKGVIDSLKAVIPLHSHYDHAMDSPIVAAIAGAKLIGSRSTGYIAKGLEDYPWDAEMLKELSWDGRIDTASMFRELEDERNPKVDALSDQPKVQLGTPLRYGDFAVTLLRSRHGPIPKLAQTEEKDGTDALTAPLVPPARRDAYKMGMPISVLVEHKGKRLLVQGSTGYLVDGLRNLRVDVVFLGVGGIMRTPPPYPDDYWCAVVRRTKATRVFAVHWDSLTHELSKQPKVPGFVMNRLGGLDVLGSLEWVAGKGVQDGVGVALLPMWHHVDPFFTPQLESAEPSPKPKPTLCGDGTGGPSDKF